MKCSKCGHDHGEKATVTNNRGQEVEITYRVDRALPFGDPNDKGMFEVDAVCNHCVAARIQVLQTEQRQAGEQAVLEILENLSLLDDLRDDQIALVTLKWVDRDSMGERSRLFQSIVEKAKAEGIVIPLDDDDEGMEVNSDSMHAIRAMGEETVNTYVSTFPLSSAVQEAKRRNDRNHDRRQDMAGRLGQVRKVKKPGSAARKMTRAQFEESGGKNRKSGRPRDRKQGKTGNGSRKASNS